VAFYARQQTDFRRMTMELFRQAFTIMVLGMGLVFVFLAVVILLVQAIAKAIHWHESVSGARGQDTPDHEEGEKVAVAMAVALHERQ
jgi:sodium pump decarboxylase gamma subunit